MPQSADKVKDHISLFQEPEYKELFKHKKENYEGIASDEAVAKQLEYTKTWEYREKNFARKHSVINPPRACQPLGSVFAAAGFEGAMPYVHGSQGCAAYFRSHLSRHFKEAALCVSDSMTEDGAVFGGLNNLVDGLQNCYALYKPKMIVMSTTCMSEVIGDDLSAFIATAKEKEVIPADFPVPFAHTPSFVGSHLNGFDVMIKGVFNYFWEREAQLTPVKGEKINIIPGFDGYAPANNREIERYLNAMGVDYTLICDVKDTFDSPTDGSYKMYYGGTKIQDCRDAINAKATVSLQEFSTEKTLEYVASKGQETLALNSPMGLAGTDAFLMEISKLTGKAIPEALELERGRLVDAIGDSIGWLHGKRVSLFGDPDFMYGLTSFLLELGMEPVHVLASNGTTDWEKKMKDLLATSPFGAETQVFIKKDLWHMRSLLFTEPVDLVIGPSWGKYLEKDTGTPLVRLGFPIFDRHHHHRFPTFGYQGALRIMVEILDRIFEVADASSDISFDLTR